MLKSIVIKNLALIGSAELNFGAGLNVLSGETGAGKSIIVDAIMLLLGNKYDKSLLRFGTKEGSVEGVFDLTREASEILTDMGYEADEEVIVLRRFFADGKNDIRINGRTVAASMLRRITEKLIDIYGQHEYISVAKTSEQGRLYDYYIRESIASPLARLRELIARLKEVNDKLASIGDSEDRERLIDILKFQLGEIEKAKVGRDEEDELMARRKVIASAEKINSALATSIGALGEDEECASSFVERALSALSGITGISDKYGELYERLKSASDELDDIVECLKDEIGDFDADDLDKIEERLGVIKNIRRKYGDYDKMTKFYSESSERLYNLENSDKIYDKLVKEKEGILDEIYSVSKELSELRRKFEPKFRTEIEKNLAELGMNAKFEIRFEPFPDRAECEKLVSPDGMDKMEFYFSPNKGQPLLPMTKIISGGEMSRFMLALKVVNGERDEMPTMIFDEIDVGISGVTGREVAKKLQNIALSHQVLCVTHLPQIAAMATNQFFIEKSVVGEETFTFVTELDRAGMIKEIARLSGVSVSGQAEAAALELKNWCDEYKSAFHS